MPKTAHNDISFSNLSAEAVKDFKAIYDTDPDVITLLCGFPGKIGKLAALCQDVGGGST